MGKRIVCLRADAGPEIGFGHFTRSLALAEMLKDDFDCVFFTVDPSEYQRREVERVCRLHPLLPASHLEDFQSCLQGDEIVVLDNYFFTTEYQKAIKSKGCRLVCIDDLHDKHYVADAVVSYTVCPEDPQPGAFCYKMLVNAEDGELYYFRKHRITRKTGPGFLVEDMNRIVEALD